MTLIKGYGQWVNENLSEEATAAPAGAPTTYDPWMDFGGGGKGLKFKSEADWNKFIEILPAITFKSEDGPSFPNIMEKNQAGVYQLKDLNGQTAQASIQQIGLTLCYLGAANSFKVIGGFANQTQVKEYYLKVFPFLTKMVPPAKGSLLTPTGLVEALDSSTYKSFLAIKKDWSNIISLKLDPIYKDRVAKFAVVPATAPK